MSTDRERLTGYIEAWRGAVDDVVSLLRELDESDWSKPTDLTGWDVRAVVAHLAHVEAVLDGAPETPIEQDPGAPAKNVTGPYTEAGVAARTGHSPAQLIEELERSAHSRHEALRADPPTDGTARPPITPSGIGWGWETLLSNRVIDLWMHEQDVRRAVGRPGGFDGPAARHTIGVFAMGLPFVLGKRVAPPAGTTVVVDVTGPGAFHAAATVGDDGRASVLPEDPAEPTVSLGMDTETFVILAGGRRDPGSVDVTIDGDEALAARILPALALTP